MRDRTVRLAAAAVALFFLATKSVLLADSIELQGDDQTLQYSGKILEEKYSAIKFQLDTAPPGTDPIKLIPVASPKDPKKKLITKLEHRPLPTIYGEGESKFRARQYAEAYERYTTSYANEKKDYPWVGAWCCYQAGEAAFREAKYNREEEQDKQQWYAKAAEQYGKVIAEAADHYLMPDGKVGLAMCQMRLSQYAQAGQGLAAVIKSDYPYWVKQEARVTSGRVKVEEAGSLKGEAARAKYDEAIAELEAVKKELMDFTPDLAYQAMIGEAYAYQGKGDLDKAENVFEVVGLQAPDDELRAEALNSRGLSLRKRGQPREALFSFLRVVLLHFDIPSEHQKALYNAAYAAKEYYKEDKEMKRALELAGTLKTRYPNGYWTKRLIREWNIKTGGE